MKNSLFYGLCLLFLSLFILGCEKEKKKELGDRYSEKIALPYRAPDEKIESLQSGIFFLNLGDSKGKVKEILGEPDRETVLFRTPKSAVSRGSYFEYLIHKKQENGSALEQENQSIRVVFNERDQLVKVQGNWLKVPKEFVEFEEGVFLDTGAAIKMQFLNDSIRLGRKSRGYKQSREFENCQENKDPKTKKVLRFFREDSSRIQSIPKGKCVQIPVVKIQSYRSSKESVLKNYRFRGVKYERRMDSLELKRERESKEVQKVTTSELVTLLNSLDISNHSIEQMKFNVKYSMDPEALLGLWLWGESINEFWWVKDDAISRTLILMSEKCLKMKEKVAWYTDFAYESNRFNSQERSQRIYELEFVERNLNELCPALYQGARKNQKGLENSSMVRLERLWGK